MTDNSIEKKRLIVSYGMVVIIVLFLISTTAQFATWKANIDAQYLEIEIKTEDLFKCYEILGAKFNILNENFILVNSEVETLKKNELTTENDLITINDKANNRDLELVEIKTKLANIEVLLLEIRKDIKDQ